MRPQERTIRLTILASDDACGSGSAMAEKYCQYIDYHQGGLRCALFNGTLSSTESQGGLQLARLQACKNAQVELVTNAPAERPSENRAHVLCARDIKVGDLFKTEICAKNKCIQVQRSTAPAPIAEPKQVCVLCGIERPSSERCLPPGERERIGHQWAPASPAPQYAAPHEQAPAPVDVAPSPVVEAPANAAAHGELSVSPCKVEVGDAFRTEAMDKFSVCTRVTTAAMQEGPERFTLWYSEDYVYALASEQVQVRGLTPSARARLLRGSNAALVSRAPVEHYMTGGYECIDVMKAISSRPSDLDGFESFCRLTAFKYLFRLGRKGAAVDDAKKALDYIQWLHKSLERKSTAPAPVTEPQQSEVRIRHYGKTYTAREFAQHYGFRLSEPELCIGASGEVPVYREVRSPLWWARETIKVWRARSGNCQDEPVILVDGRHRE